MARFPLPPQVLSLKGLTSWAQTLVRQLNQLSVSSSSGTPGTSSSGSTVSDGSFVPLTFKGTPLVFVTDAPGNLILVRFDHD